MQPPSNSVTEMKGRKPELQADANAITETRPPAWLSEHAKAEFRRVMPELARRRSLTPADLGCLESYCVAIGKVRGLEQLLRAGFDANPNSSLPGGTSSPQPQPQLDPALALWLRLDNTFINVIHLRLFRCRGAPSCLPFTLASTAKFFIALNKAESFDLWRYCFSIGGQERIGTIEARLGLLAARRVRGLIDRALRIFHTATD